MTFKASRLELLSWCLYDFADSSFTTIIVTVAYGLYFRTVVAGHLGTGADALWGAAIAGSMLVVSLCTPVLGAIADLAGRKKPFLVGFALMSMVFTALLNTVEPGDLISGVLLFALANLGFEAAHVFYNGFLPEIATDDALGRVSGHGWALGYIGGLAALALTYPLTRGGFGPENLARYRLAFPVVALFFLIFALPAFLLLRERAARSPAGILGSARGGVRRLLATFHGVRRLPDLFRFLLAFFIYNDGVATVIAFSGIYAMHVVGFTVGQVYLLFLVTQITAFAGAFAAGHLVDRLGARPTIVLGLLLWCGVVAGAAVSRSVPVFMVVAAGASVGMGWVQTASRSLMGLLLPAGRNAEFFGFFGFTGKISAILGPLLYGQVAAATGSERAAVLSLLMFFVAGAVLMLRVDVAAGRTAAGRTVAS
ncbi:MAG: MFS transporter [Candidatus Polarisedimenticolia bacterium]